MNTNGKIAQKRYGGRRDLFVISFAIFQTAGHDFYALDKDTQDIYLLEHMSDRALQQNEVD